MESSVLEQRMSGQHLYWSEVKTTVPARTRETRPNLHKNQLEHRTGPVLGQDPVQDSVPLGGLHLCWSHTQEERTALCEVRRAVPALISHRKIGQHLCCVRSGGPYLHWSHTRISAAPCCTMRSTTSRWRLPSGSRGRDSGRCPDDPSPS